MKKLLIGLTLLGASLSASAETVILNNCVLKQSPQTRVVEVSYELTGDTPVYITADITTNGVSIADLMKVSGDITTINNLAVIEPGPTPKKIYWAAKLDWPGNLTTEARATVTAWFTNDPPASVMSYAVVDLSDGPTASWYPVRYSNTPPYLGTTSKTTELWLKRIPAGTFTMGSPDGELGRDDANEVQHQVTLTKGFFLGVFPVTQKQYERVMGGGPPVGITAGDTLPVVSVTYDNIRGAGVGAQWPASNGVDTMSFMGRLQEKTGLTFDLPTEAQWEYACRAGTTGAWNNGTTITNVAADANLALLGRYTFNGGNLSGGNVSVVGSYQPNAYGLYDMHGNVREWCLDWFAVADPLGTAVIDPKGPATSGNTTTRVLRGGSWYAQAATCRSATRLNWTPTANQNNTFGFRVAIQPSTGQ